MHDVFRSIKELCLLMGPDLTIIDATNKFVEATGTTRENLIGKYVFDAFPWNPADPNNNVPFFKDCFERAARGEEVMLPPYRYDIVSKDGTHSERWWRTTGSPVFNQDGTVKYVLCQTLDVTMIKAEEELATLICQLREKISSVFQNLKKFDTPCKTA